MIGAVATVGAIAFATGVERVWMNSSTGQAASQHSAPRLAAPASIRSQEASVARRDPGLGAVAISAGPGGHFRADVEIEGRRVPMLVDTGATLIALTAEDARAIGVNTFPADYTANVSTANGVARAAPTMLREVRIEGVVAYDVQALVMPRGALRQSLLGMSFLRKLRGFEIADGRLLMRQ